MSATQLAAGGAQTATTISTTQPLSNNGIVFTGYGYLYEGYNTSLYSVNPATGAQVGVTSTVSQTLVDLASCGFPPSITLKKNVVARYATGDQFGLSITGGGLSAGNTATTSGTANGVQSAVAGPVPAVASTAYTLTETASGTTNLANYVTSYACIDTANGNAPITTAPVTTDSFTVTLPTPTGALGQGVVCTFTNTSVPTLQVTKALGGARLAATDQFTTQIRTGSATGTVVNSTTNSTTTGTGSTVTAGTGTTGVYTGTVGTTYYVTEAAAGTTTLFNYTPLITCTDANGLQTGLPTNAAFPGSYAITPVAGASISCTLTNTPAPTSR